LQQIRRRKIPPQFKNASCARGKYNSTALAQQANGSFAMHRSGPRQIRNHCELFSDSERLLERAMQQQGLSARAYDRILKVARTIADLDNTPEI
jgi:magnesium chelatase family protein